MEIKQEKIDSRVSDFLDRFQKNYKSPGGSSSNKKVPLNENVRSGGKLISEPSSTKENPSKTNNNSFLSQIHSQNRQAETHSPINKFLDGYKTQKGRYQPQKGIGVNHSSIGSKYGLFDTNRKLKFTKKEEFKNNQSSNQWNEDSAEKGSQSPEQITMNTQESTRANIHDSKIIKKPNLTGKHAQGKTKHHQNQIQTLLKTRSLSPPASLKHILSQDYKHHECENEKSSDEEKVEKNPENIPVAKAEKSERKSFGASKIFSESSKKIESLENNQISKENFDEEVKDLISLIKKEKQVIVNDMTHLSKQMHKYKDAYTELKKKVDSEKVVHNHNNLGSRFSLPISGILPSSEQKIKNIPLKVLFMKESIREKGIQTSITNSELKNTEFSETPQDENPGSTAEHQEECLKVPEKEAEFVTKDQARRASSINPRQLKLVGRLLNTLNIDKSLNVKLGAETAAYDENEQTIFLMLSKLTKDEMIELQLNVIQNLVEQINAGA